MTRRHPSASVIAVSALAVCLPVASFALGHREPSSPSALPGPIVIYSHIAESPGALSPNQPGEAQVVSQLAEVVRLRKSGVRFDYDLVDALWFLNSGFRMSPTSTWPNGPGPWIDRCRSVRILPGLRFGGNTLGANQPIASLPPEWKTSLSQSNRSLSLFEGGFLPGMISAMQSWHDRGIRLFVFDSLDLTAATPAAAASITRDQIVARNSSALHDALLAFGKKNPDTVLLIFTQPAGNPDSSSPPLATAGAPGAPVGSSADLNRLGGFEILSAGAAKTQSLPPADPSRAIDIQNDTRARSIEQAGVPLEHIASSGFTVSGEGSPREQDLPRDWKGAFLLSMARGSWVNIVRGRLQPIQGEDARWMARVQKIFLGLQDQGGIHSFGSPAVIAANQDPPPYGFAATTSRGSLFVVVNPGQAPAALALPLPAAADPVQSEGRVQFRDAGFAPQLKNGAITLGPGQLAMVGFGDFAAPALSLGIQHDVVVPSDVELLDADFHPTAPGTIEARFDPPIEGVLRVVIRDLPERPRTSSGSAAPSAAGNDSSAGLTLDVTQSGRPIPFHVDTGAPSPSAPADAGPSWLVGEIDVNDLTPGLPVRVRVHSNLDDPPELEGRAYQVVY